MYIIIDPLDAGGRDGNVLQTQQKPAERIT